MIDYYERQRTLSIYPPTKAVVVGVGGVGAWVALELALIGTETIYLIDDDDVEATNLNRTPFTVAQIGQSKVSAVAELINERRVECNVIAFQCRAEALPPDELDMLRDANLFDCRDSVAPLDLPGTIRCGIVGGYDGTSVTIHTNPSEDTVFGANNVVRYRTVPSFVGAPALIAAIIVNYFCLHQMIPEGERIVTFDLKNIVDILTRGNLNE